MSRFHISKSGKPAPCKAQQGGCPFGGESNHYNTREEAQSAYEKESAEQFSVVSSASKTPYSAPASSAFKETVSLPGDNSTEYKVSNVKGVPTALEYSGKIVQDEEKARKILEASINQGDGSIKTNPYSRENYYPETPKVASRESRLAEAGGTGDYSLPASEKYKETVTLPGDNSGTEYRVTNIEGIPTATEYSGKIIEDPAKARQVLEASMNN